MSSDQLFVTHFYFFFFKQKTAYEMRISDWSSDVCSSDLTLSTTIFAARRVAPPDLIVPALASRAALRSGCRLRLFWCSCWWWCSVWAVRRRWGSEQRRVRKECVSKRRPRCTPYH